MKNIFLLIAVILITILASIGTFAIGADNRSEQNEKELQKFLSGKEGPAMVVYTQLILWRCGYFSQSPLTGKIDEKTQKALRKYQEQRGLPITGKLDMMTFDQIAKDSDLLDPEPVGVIGYSFTDIFWDSYFKATGTWVFENSNENMANPVQKTEINCYRDLGRCIEATADISFKAKLLDVTSEIYDIGRWDEYEIVTEPYDYHCTRYVIRINRKQRSVKKLRTTIRTKELCKAIDTKDKYIQLSDGHDEYWEFRSKFYEKRSNIYDPSWEKQFEKIEEMNR